MAEKPQKTRYHDRPPLPVGAEVNAEDIAFVRLQAEGLPDTLEYIEAILDERSPYNDFDATLREANIEILRRLELYRKADDTHKRALIVYAKAHMSPSECVAVGRMLIRSSSGSVRNSCLALLQAKQPTEVGLPRAQGEAWDWTGMARGIEPGRLFSSNPSVAKLEARNLPVLKTVAELREVLRIKSSAQLGYLLLGTELNDGPYTTFTVPKRSGAERLICAPKTDLKRAQQRILSTILSVQDPHDAAHGFVTGRSIVTNAAAHQGRKILVKFDLKDFFPSISFYRVMGLFTHMGYYIEDGIFSNKDDSRAIAPVLARLTTYTRNAKRWQGGFTPQGAPTSPAISNLICRRLDSRLTGLAAKVGATYTRYADDLTFSMDTAPKSGLGRFRWWVDQICYQEGFLVNHSKFRVIRDGQRQQVTGVVVNDVLRVPREERRTFRAILHNCRKHGVESQANGRHGFEDWLRGYASYINMVNPTEGARLLKEVKALLDTNAST